MSRLGIYVHLPFCPYICPYCDFVKWPHRAGAARRYLTALHAQITHAAQNDMPARDLARSDSTVFLGGGTPNAYEASEIADLLARLRAAFPGDPERETTIEVNPELVRARDMQAYRRAGITRVSIGVQSFVPQEIRTLGRGHTAQDVQRVVAECRAAAMRSVSLDLMFAVPGQTPKSWLRTLDAAIALGVDHVSAYGLTVEAGTPYERWRDRDPGAFFDDAREAEFYDLAIRTLEDAGYEQYEISNFAKPGHRSEHNANYWSNGDYIGLGVGAASYRNGVRSVCTKDFETYVASALEGRAAAVRIRTAAGSAALRRGSDALAANCARGLSPSVQRAVRREFFGVLRARHFTLPCRRTAGGRRDARASLQTRALCGKRRMRRFRDQRVGSGIAAALLRLLFALVFGITGFLLGREAYVHLFSLHAASEALQMALTIATPVAGAILGVLLAPLAQSLFEDELNAVERAIERLAPIELAGGAVGLILGLIVAFLIRSILFEFISTSGRAGSYIAILLYIVISIFAAYLGARVGARMHILPLMPSVAGMRGAPKIIDTSVIVDGRIVEILQSGFLEGPFILPRFVLRELQAVADSADSMKRTRGRRGLEVLNRLQELGVLEVSERDYDDVRGADAKLVRIAQELRGKLLTNDYNLNRVAHVEGVNVLNINELADAVRPVVLPGEELRVQIVREGKEPHQGVGYLDDGTMIVVEHGRRLVGAAAEVVVTSVLQTAAGRMIFARPKGSTVVPAAKP